MINSISPITLWLIVGIIFIVVELFLPGFIIGFFGLGAIVTCLTTVTGLTKGFTLQMIVFISISIISLILFHKVFKRKNCTDEKVTTDFNIQIGKIVTVIEFIDPDEGCGKVRYQGAIWNASSKDKIAPGESARVIGCDNLTLIVEEK